MADEKCASPLGSKKPILGDLGKYDNDAYWESLHPAHGGSGLLEAAVARLLDAVSKFLEARTKHLEAKTARLGAEGSRKADDSDNSLVLDIDENVYGIVGGNVLLKK